MSTILGSTSTPPALANFVHDPATGLSSVTLTITAYEGVDEFVIGAGGLLKYCGLSVQRLIINRVVHPDVAAALREAAATTRTTQVDELKTTVHGLVGTVDDLKTTVSGLEDAVKGLTDLVASHGWTDL